MGDLQGMERQWQLLVANEASASPSFWACVCVREGSACISLCHHAAGVPVPVDPELLPATVHSEVFSYSLLHSQVVVKLSENLLDITPGGRPVG